VREAHVQEVFRRGWREVGGGVEKGEVGKRDQGGEGVKGARRSIQGRCGGVI